MLQRRYSDAEPLLQRSIAVYKAQFDIHPYIPRVRSTYAVLLQKTGRRRDVKEIMAEEWRVRNEWRLSGNLSVDVADLRGGR